MTFHLGRATNRHLVLARRARVGGSDRHGNTILRQVIILSRASRPDLGPRVLQSPLIFHFTLSVPRPRVFPPRVSLHAALRARRLVSGSRNECPIVNPRSAITDDGLPSTVHRIQTIDANRDRARRSPFTRTRRLNTSSAWLMAQSHDYTQSIFVE